MSGGFRRRSSATASAAQQIRLAELASQLEFSEIYRLHRRVKDSQRRQSVTPGVSRQASDSEATPSGILPPTVSASSSAADVNLMTPPPFSRDSSASASEPTTPVGVGGSAAVRAPRTSDLYGISGEQLFDLRQRLHLPPEAAPSASAADASSAAAAPSSEQQQYPHGYVMLRGSSTSLPSRSPCAVRAYTYQMACRPQSAEARSLSPATIDQRLWCCALPTAL